MFHIIAFLFGLSFLICAGIGFFQVVLWVLKLLLPEATGPGPVDRASQARQTLDKSPIAFCQQLDWLYLNNLLPEAAWLEARAAVENRFGQEHSLPPRPVPGSPLPDQFEDPLTAPPKHEAYARVRPPMPEFTRPSWLASEIAPPAGSSSDWASDEAIEAEAIPRQEPLSTAPPVPTFAPPEPLPSPSAIGSSVPATSPPEPSTPEPSPPEPSTPEPSTPGRARPQPRQLAWSELVKGFMEERNIRWGELASGILIVGSAIGLVLSLRNELQDRIPYFPALLFLLFSLAIHSAGAYTLKRWKLRSTSRGLLYIGLLIVPLNFLGAAILSASPDLQRPLTDPLVWLAIAVGLGAFGWMSWSTSRLLFRGGIWLPVLATMGAGLSIVILNRCLTGAGGGWQAWYGWPLSLVPVGSLGALAVMVERRRRLTPRTLSRIWLLLGVVVFSLAAVVALVVSRDGLRPLSSLAASLGVFLIAIQLLAHRLIRRSTTDGLRFQRVAAIAVLMAAIAGLLEAARWAAPWPGDFTIFAAATGVACLVMARAQRLWWALPIATVLLTAAMIVSIAIGNGQTGWQERLGPAGLQQLFVDGKSALCWFASGLILFALTPWLNTWFGNRSAWATPDSAVGGSVGRGPGKSSAMLQRHLVVSCAFLGLGALTGNLAARWNPERFFDATVSVTLLAGLAIALLTLATSPRMKVQRYAWLPWLALLASALAVEDGVLNNRFLFAFLPDWKAGWNGSLLLACLLLAVLWSLVAVVGRVRGSQLEHRAAWTGTRVRVFAGASMLATGGGMLVAFLRLGSGEYLQGVEVAVGLLFLAAATAALAGSRNPVCRIEQFSLPATLLIAGFLLMSRNPAGIHDWSIHGTLQVLVTAAWVLVWLALYNWNRNPGTRGSWVREQTSAAGLMPLRFHELVAVLVPGLLCLWTLLMAVPPILREIVLFVQLQTAPPWPQANEWRVTGWMHAGWITATLACLVVRRRACSGQILAILLGSLAWVLASHWDADHSFATAARWMLALSGAATSLCFWLPFLRDQGRPQGTADSTLPSRDFDPAWRSSVIRPSLAYTIGAGLSLAMLALSAWLLVGPETLGDTPRQSWLGTLRKDLSYGLPIAIILATLLNHAITQRQIVHAISGSLVLQLVVVLQLVLLFLSPHPKLASTWFTSVIQFVSIAMTLYGVTWWGLRNAIEEKREPAAGPAWLELHAILNTLLVLGLVALVLGRYLIDPLSSGGWINHAASPLGILSATLLTGFLWVLFVRGKERALAWPSAVALTGLVTFLAANLDRFWGGPEGVQGIALHTLVWGMLTAALLHGWFFVQGWSFASGGGTIRQPAVGQTASPDLAASLLPASLGTLLAIRGMFVERGLYPEMATALLLLGLGAMMLGWHQRSAGVAEGVSLFAVLQAGLLALFDPWEWFGASRVQCLHGTVAGILVVALGSAGFALYRRGFGRELVSRRFLQPASITGLLAAGWFVVAPGLHTLEQDLRSGTKEGFWTWPANAMVVGTTVLMALQGWNARSSFQWIARGVFSLGLPWVILDLSGASRERLLPQWLLLMALVVWGWGVSVQFAVPLGRLARSGRVLRVSAGAAGARDYLPAASWMLAGLVGYLAAGVVVGAPERWDRIVASLAVVLLAAGQFAFAEGVRRTPFRIAALALLSTGLVFLSWSEWVPALGGWPTRLARAIWVLTAVVVLSGWILLRWIPQSNGWREAFRWMELASAAVAVGCLAALVGCEWSPGLPSAEGLLSTADAIAVAIAALVLAIRLIVIALVPRLSPLALSDTARQWYVHAAQGVLALAIAHLAATMPWLLRLGLRDYWPYLAMLVAFGGVGLAEILRRRNLMVLAEPLSQSMALLPVVAAFAALGTTSLADRALTMFLAGLVCLVSTVLRGRVWTGLMALVFSNAALWLYLDRWPGLQFSLHPQLWLIPPALGVLATAEWGRIRYHREDLHWLRYVCLTVIYVSSTCEIFLVGLGEQLWPPMILAFLAVCGMLAGMMFRIRPFIAIGMLFLLMAMIAMVAHAQRRLGHVWPWWAFGITMGILILVLFGWFERQRNRNRQEQTGRSLDPPGGNPGSDT